ncbi:MAG: peptidoglycan-binding domain-containing protein [Mycobacteriales bacterium]|nr:MAG: hypothetical protein DLM56_02180 [Pseudonocardiales bacterium]
MGKDGRGHSGSVGERGLHRGSTGTDVAILQKRLAAPGFRVRKFGRTFDHDTEHELRAFQHKHGLPRTGHVDARTAKALLDPGSRRNVDDSGTVGDHRADHQPVQPGHHLSGLSRKEIVKLARTQIGTRSTATT